MDALHLALGQFVNFLTKHELEKVLVHRRRDKFAEELTLAERAIDLGLAVVYNPSVRVHHDEHASTGVWRGREVIEWQRQAVAYSSRLLKARRSRNQ